MSFRVPEGLAVGLLVALVVTIVGTVGLNHTRISVIEERDRSGAERFEALLNESRGLRSDIRELSDLLIQTRAEREADAGKHEQIDINTQEIRALQARARGGA